MSRFWQQKGTQMSPESSMLTFQTTSALQVLHGAISLSTHQRVKGGGSLRRRLDENIGVVLLAAGHHHSSSAKEQRKGLIIKAIFRLVVSACRGGGE